MHEAPGLYPGPTKQMTGAVVNCGTDVGIQDREVRFGQSQACDKATKRSPGSLLLEQSVHHLQINEAGPLCSIRINSVGQRP